MYYIRFDRGSSKGALNLLYRPSTDLEGPEAHAEANQGLRRLAARIGQGKGSLWYYEGQEACLRSLKIEDIQQVSVWRYDGEAPYTGLYLDTPVVEPLWDMED